MMPWNDEHLDYSDLQLSGGHLVSRSNYRVLWEGGRGGGHSLGAIGEFAIDFSDTPFSMAGT